MELFRSPILMLLMWGFATVAFGGACVRNEPEEKSVTIYYIRHGQSEANEMHEKFPKWKKSFEEDVTESEKPQIVNRDFVDTKLTTQGEKEAQEARDYLNEHFKEDKSTVAFISSPLRRAFATMAIAGAGWLNEERKPIYVHGSLSEAGPGSPSSNTKNDYDWSENEEKDQRKVLTSYLNDVCVHLGLPQCPKAKNFCGTLKNQENIYNFTEGISSENKQTRKRVSKPDKNDKGNTKCMDTISKLYDDIFTIAEQDSKNTFIVGGHSMLMQRLAEFAQTKSDKNEWGCYADKKLGNGAILKFDVTQSKEQGYLFSKPELMFKSFELPKKKD